MSEYAELLASQVRWYRKHGRYPFERIAKTIHGEEYVIGDWSWSRKCPGKPERIESRMGTGER